MVRYHVKYCVYETESLTVRTLQASVSAGNTNGLYTKVIYELSCRSGLIQKYLLTEAMTISNEK